MAFCRDREGWTAAWHELGDVQSAVDGVLRRLVGAQDPEYEDLMQSSLENVIATFDRGRFRGECPTGGWAAVIARNVAVDAIRVRARERQLFSYRDADLSNAEVVRDGSGDLDPEQLTGVQERLGRVREALLGIGPRKSNVVVLHDVLGYRLEEIARILGISIAAAQSRLVRGRREIIDCLDGPGTGEATPRRRALAGERAFKDAAGSS